MCCCRFFRFVLIFAAAIGLSACHSRKLIVKDNNNPQEQTGVVLPKHGPYVMVKPEKEIAEKYAAIMNVKRNDIQNGRLYNFIDEWMGTPYQFGGMGKEGVDCSALVFLLQLQVYDRPVPRTCALQVTNIKRKYENELNEGDLVFFDFDGKQYSHVGIYLQNGYILHASTRRGVIIVKLHDQGIYKYFSRAGSVADVPVEPEADTADTSQ